MADRQIEIAELGLASFKNSLAAKVRALAVKALITVASNPVLSAPGSPRLAAALDTLDFMVSVDIYLNETTRHADVILPGRSPLEDGHFEVAFGQLSMRNHARYSPPVGLEAIS